MLTTGITDAGGVPLGSPFQQTFTTGAGTTSGGGGTGGTSGGPLPVVLCPGVGNIAVLAGSTVTNTGPTTVSGAVAVSPGTAVTGFPPGLATGGIDSNNGAASNAQTALTAAYNDAASRSGAVPLSGNIGGMTLTAGVYHSASSLSISSGNLTLDAQGNSAAVFIFQIGSTLKTASGTPASGTQVILKNGAKPCNVFWQVGSSATLGTYSKFAGNILADQSITITTGVDMQGSALARIGAVTLDTDVITGCQCP